MSKRHSVAKQQSASALTRPPAEKGADGGRTGRILCALAIVAWTLIAFLPAFSHGFVDWDDPDNFLNNPHYRGLAWENIQWMFSTFHMGHYQPLSWLSLGIDATIAKLMWGDALDPRPYHATNVLLHMANALLVFAIAHTLLRRVGPLDTARKQWPRLLAATIAALLFSVHPLRVESVAWATERRDLLSGGFVLLSVVAYLRAVRPEQPRYRFWLAVSLALFLLSLMSKVIGVTLPVVLLVLDWYPLKRLHFNAGAWFTRAALSILLEKAPYFALSVVFSIIATVGQGSNRWLVTLDMHPPGARLVQALYGLTFYAWKTVLPLNLLPLYQLEYPMNLAEPRYVFGAITTILAIILVTTLIIAGRARAFIAAALIYGVMLLPVLGLVQNGSQIVADRYSYLACIGWAVAGGAAWLWTVNRCHASASRVVLGLVTGLIIAVLSALTWRQSLVWRDTASLWTHTHMGDPRSTLAMNGYGYVLLGQGRLDEAIGLFQRVIDATPDNDKAHHNLWAALQRKGDVQELERAYLRGEGIPLIAARAHYQHGMMLLNRRDEAGAIEHLGAAWALDPTHLPSGANLGIALHRAGRSADAVQQFQAVLRDHPDYFSARYNIAFPLRALKRMDEAVEHLRVAVTVNPQHDGARKLLTELSPSAP
jgi:protein O-mannosyl-transferase